MKEEHLGSLGPMSIKVLVDRMDVTDDELVQIYITLSHWTIVFLPKDIKRKYKNLHDMLWEL